VRIGCSRWAKKKLLASNILLSICCCGFI